MKRISILLIALLVVFSASAKKYKHSLGLTTGFSYGVSYKGMLTDNFTIMADLDYGFSMIATRGGGGLMDCFGAKANFAYQGKAASGKNIDLFWFAGGGTQLGGVNYCAGGKWGFNGIGGIEINFTNAPIAITADFRAGYSLAFFPGGGGDVEYDPELDDWVPVGGGGVTLTHLFDSSINFGIRYTF